MTSRKRYLKRVTLESKLLLLLHSSNISGDLYTVPEIVTQGGMAKELMIRRNNISRALCDLSSRDLVMSRTKHIEGIQRRRKAFFLTDTGKEEVSRIISDLDSRLVPVRNLEDDLVEWTFSRCVREISSIEMREVSRFRILNEMIEDRMLDLTNLKASSGFSNDPHIPETGRVFGRRKEKARIIKALESGSHYISIVGIAGQGKTSLAADLLSDTSKTFVWISINRWISPDILLDEIEISLWANNRTRHAENRDIYPRIRNISSALSGKRGILVMDDLHRSPKETEDMVGLLSEMAARDGWTLMTLSRRKPAFHGDIDAATGKDDLIIELGGMERQDSVSMLREIGLDEREAERVHETTSGHPLAMRICSLNPGADPKTISGSFRSFLEDSIFGYLSEEERRTMELLAAFDIPIAAVRIAEMARVDMVVVSSLVSKLLARRYTDGRVDLHDSLREAVRDSLTGSHLRKLREDARDHHASMSDDIDMVQNILISRDLGDDERVRKAVLKDGEYLIGRGYLTISALVTEMMPGDLSKRDIIRWLLLSYDSAISLGDREGSVEFLKKAGDMARELNLEKRDPRSLEITTMILNRLAERAISHGRYMDVIGNLSRGIRIARRSGAPDQEARLLSNVGMAYLDLGEPSMARNYLDEALDLFRKIGNERGIAVCRLNRGQACLAKGDLAGGLEEYLRSVLSARKAKARRVSAQASFGIARIYQFVDEPGEALPFLRDCALDHCREGDLDHALIALMEMVRASDGSDMVMMVRTTIERMHLMISGGGWSHLKYRMGWSDHSEGSDRQLLKALSRLISGKPVDRTMLERSLMSPKSRKGIDIRCKLISDTAGKAMNSGYSRFLRTLDKVEENAVDRINRV